VTFGELLNEHLLRNDRPAAWLADRLGHYPSTVTRWLSDESRPRDLETVVRIADILGVRAGDERQALIESAGFAYFEAPAPAQEQQTQEQQTQEEQTQEEQAQEGAPAPSESPTSTPVTRIESPPPRPWPHPCSAICPCVSAGGWAGMKRPKLRASVGRG
jgi:hypothetical protein